MDAIQALVDLFANVKFCRLLGNWMPSKLWLKSQPHINFCRLLSRWMPSELWLNSSLTSKFECCWAAGCPESSG